MKPTKKTIFDVVRYFCITSILIFGLIAIVGTGGGGGDDGGGGSTEGKIYNLHMPGSDEPGFQITVNLSGSSSAGEEIKGTSSIAVREKTIIDGQTVIPHESLLTIEINDIPALSFFGTTYYSEDGEPVLKISGDASYEPMTIAELPETGEIGDFGQLTSWLCSDGSTTYSYLRLEEAAGGMADIVITETGKDKYGNITVFSEGHAIIDEDGYRHSMSLELYYPDYELTVNLYGEVD